MSNKPLSLKAATALLPSSVLPDKKRSERRSALKESPRDIRRAVANARALAAAESFAEAAVAFEQALALDPNNLAVLQTYADFAQQMTRRLAERAAVAAGETAPEQTARTTEWSGLGAVRVSSGDRPDPAFPPPWPNRRVLWQDTDKVFRRHILGEIQPRPGMIAPDTRVVTMGSCFARNVGAELMTYGVPVYFQLLKEEMNSTYANLKLVQWAINGPVDEDTQSLESEFGPEARAAMRSELAGCAVYIFSLGVAPISVDAEGRFLLRPPKGLKRTDDILTVTSGPKENADNVRAIIELIRSINPAVQIFLTLSPVPLAGTTERKSAVIADCLSKSSLRLAVEDVMADRMPGVHYWPSFEMVKWWGAHLREDRAFGDDGKTRHVSPWIVNHVIRLFVEYFGGVELLNARRVDAVAPPPETDGDD